MPGVADSRPLKTAITQSNPNGRLFGNRDWIFGLILVFATIIAYQQVWHGGFFWDDDDYVTHNLLLHSLKGLWLIWSVPGATPQYYPLLFTSFWVDYHLWQLNPLGYHLTNVLLQALNAILLWAVLRRLNVPGAWLAAAIFALHPVNVETVACVAERKNLLAGFFYLSSALACLRFWLPNPATADGRATSFSETPAIGLGSWKFYWLALILYLCALLAKTAAVALPVAVLLVVWWKRGKMGWRELFPLAPFLAVGMVMGLLTVWVEKHFVHATGSEWAFSFLERCLIAGKDVWFYLGKLAWPHPLIFIYPRWNFNASHPAAYLPVVAVIVTLFILWFNRRGWARPMLVALAYFLALLFPVLGFFNVFFFRFSFVADHFQYLASIGPITLAAAGIDKLFRSLRDQQPFWKPIFCGTLLLVLGMLTWRQCAIYADIETLWQTTARLNPNCWIAYNNLGYALIQKGSVDEAITQYQRALEIKPDYEEAHYNLGNALIRKGSVDEAIAQYQTALQIKPDYAEAHDNLGNALIERGSVGEAITQYQKALEINPYYPRALNNLAWTLATSPQASLRNGDKAVALAQRANQLTGGENPTILYTLAAAYAEAGRFSDAMRSAQKAIELAQAEGRQDMVEQLNSELKLYEMGLPFHQESR